MCARVAFLTMKAGVSTSLEKHIRGSALPVMVDYLCNSNPLSFLLRTLGNLDKTFLKHLLKGIPELAGECRIIGPGSQGEWRPRR